MAQSINTKYFGATDRRGARIKATSSSGWSRTVGYDDNLSTDGNHNAAAVALCKRLDWTGRLAVGGGRKGDGNVYVFIDASAITVRADKCVDCKQPSHTGFCSVKPKWVK